MSPRLPLLPQQPRTRGECASVPRPCPFANCYWHIDHDHTKDPEMQYRSEYYENRLIRRIETGQTTSCVLDMSEHPNEQAEVAAAIGVTPQQVNNIEQKALRKLKNSVKTVKKLKEFV